MGLQLSSLPKARDSEAEYEATVHSALWRWADRYHTEHLDGGKRTKRPPVLAAQFADLNILVPSDESRGRAIRSGLPRDQRHAYFPSLRSSQALTQSVFGALDVFGRLDLLETIVAECGRPAFFTNHSDWSLKLEHEVRMLQEPRPTSIDVVFRRHGRVVAVECKFTEREFGMCSAPLRNPNHQSYCDGSYRVQAGRTERCARTERGIAYWRYLPQVFAWPSNRDLIPCPFNETYQLARNALAGVVTEAGGVDLDRGHVLLMYDDRNPAFQFGGRTERQWEAALAACLVPGLLRRLSWQRLLRYLGQAGELVWLCDALADKYGIEPN